ncbi:MAG: pantetheine-phosphate adenylyltransferase [Erysipelotrichaceae bacterium]|nr:pantetheine-phosphate adenylyltransferase [Erysipelotrichaceae bacterium]
MVKAVYSGTFDPVTNGHLDIIERASKMFDEVYVTIFGHPTKTALLTIEERIDLLNIATKHLDNVHVDASTSLAVDYCRKVGATILLRGIRNTSDYEYESNMAYANRYLDSSVETLFMVTSPEFAFVSSSRVKEIASFHRDVNDLVPACVAGVLKKKYEEKSL